MFRKLPELRKAIADLEARLAELEARLKANVIHQFADRQFTIRQRCSVMP